MAYFANGTEGAILDEQCADCPLGIEDDPRQGRLFGDCQVPKFCPVAALQLIYNYDQLKKGNEQLRAAMTMLIDDKGICQVRKELKDG